MSQIDLNMMLSNLKKNIERKGFKVQAVYIDRNMIGEDGWAAEVYHPSTRASGDAFDSVHEFYAVHKAYVNLVANYENLY